MKSSMILKSSALVLALFVSGQAASQSLDLESDEGRAGYSIGVNIGLNLSSQGIAEDLNIQSLIAGLTDALNGSDLKMSDEEILAAIQEFTILQQSKAMAEIEAEAERGRDFLVRNAENEGVTTTASGLQYEVIEKTTDSGAPRPRASDTVNVHYHGTLVDGTVFDSSVERGQPISFPLNGVIPGWTEGLQLMQVGDKFRFFIPSDLAYGPSGAGPIGPNATLIFEVELLDIE